MLSVSVQFDETDFQLIGSIKLNATELYNKGGTQYEIPLLPHDHYPEIVLRTTISTFETLLKLLSGTIRRRNASRANDIVEKLFVDRLTVYHDFDCHGNPESLDQAISKFEAIAEATPEDDPRFLVIIGGLGIFLRCRFSQFEHQGDIDKPIERLEMAIAVTADTDSKMLHYSGSPGNALLARFHRFGNVADMPSSHFCRHVRRQLERRHCRTKRCTLQEECYLLDIEE
ncbi:hypothetical protein CPB86DRAFT_357787 [Serendipita vermifera]|nr:hypothetical protein CPB86DRAFT_357787 [Serendipita vermifera]